jgi:hypothetical protein
LCRESNPVRKGKTKSKENKKQGIKRKRKCIEIQGTEAKHEAGTNRIG